ncbi:hypothetical protein Ae168Ps1_0958c [Pseudonocardia sp. Ae168_Ps1]|nr:hypothetical protein Ae150APs1_0958c [Pseudonocardia sp. Ae150A_Ps1]OLL78552.1 hypothetical protein Ae168Ps1_0958c [Pseudonocardia sp. Ae168_Ps1]OLL87322.1 hypothetical protein Ae263Ps1_4377 [Pseudonocardia sp. Ae263_Ps1]OLL92648.1 hypothetical protein Ae356Ps1_2545c [Pseudonocardia sp. Ae356_Ps1]
MPVRGASPRAHRGGAHAGDREGRAPDDRVLARRRSRLPTRTRPPRTRPDRRHPAGARAPRPASRRAGRLHRRRAG